MRCRECHQLNILLYNQSFCCQLDRSCEPVIIRFRLPPELLMTSATVMDDRGGWTEIFGGKASEQETSRPVQKRSIYLPHLHLGRWTCDRQVVGSNPSRGKAA